MLNIKLIQIDKSEFDRLSNCEETYFTNGCLFDDDNDNLVAFPLYSNPTDEPDNYYKVIKYVK